MIILINRKLEEKYMTYEELMKIEYSKGEKSGEARGREQGREEERGKMLLLISKMSTDGI